MVPMDFPMPIRGGGFNIQLFGEPSLSPKSWKNRGKTEKSDMAKDDLI